MVLGLECFCLANERAEVPLYVFPCNSLLPPQARKPEFPILLFHCYVVFVVCLFFFNLLSSYDKQV